MPFRLGGALLASFLAVCAACHPVPQGRVAVTSVEVEGNQALGDDELEKELATRKSARFLGLWRGVMFDQEVYDPSLLQKDVTKLERYYRSRGFYSARVRAARVFDEGDDRVRVSLVVDEGAPVIISRVALAGVGGLSAADVRDLRDALGERLAPGKRFEEREYQKGQRRIQDWLNDRSFAWAKVERSAFVDVSRNTAKITYSADVGPKAVFGKIRVEGLGDLPRDVVMRVIDIEPGEPYSRARLEKARQALLDLGALSSVEMQPDLSGDRSRPVNLMVRVERTKTHGGQVGGGFEFTQLESNVHLLLAWGSNNFLGGARTLSLELEPGLVLYPTRVPTFEKPTHLFPEVTVRARFRQPAFIESRTSGLARLQFSVYPVLLVPEVNPEDPVLGYAEVRESIGVERKFWKLSVVPSLNVQQNEPFAYAGEIDPSLTMLRLSYLELASTLDLRDNVDMPHAGGFADLRMQATAGRLGADAVTGSISDYKVRTELRGYLPVASRTTLGLRGTLGALWPDNWGETLDDPVPSNDDVQISYFRSFFSGGPNSNRGWPYRGIGKHGIAPFLSPGVTEAQLTNECLGAESEDVRCRSPFGGLSLWEASIELRQRVGQLEGVAFCDASDVSSSELTFDLDEPHLSCGPGLRYVTPIGPLRFDVAYRIPGLNPTEEQIQAGEDGDPGEVFGAPIGLVLGLGEAF